MNLELAILHVLSAAPRALNSAALAGYLPAFSGRDHTIADIDLALRSLERKGHVKGTANPDRGTLWKETDDGRLRCA